jgi:SAM-dependent methyltransferase
MPSADEYRGLRRHNSDAAGHGRHRAPPASGRQPAGGPRGRTDPAVATAERPAEVFTKFVLDYAAQHEGRTITLLQAGCTTAGDELSLDALRGSPYDVAFSLVDDDVPATREAIASRPELSGAILGELRSLPIAPRSFDIVHCPMLLHRIDNAELVLGRLVAALRPAGLLLIRTVDRQTAAGFLDRTLPEPARAAMWRSDHGGQPGPYPAIYEPIASATGIEAYVTRHGLAIAHRQTCRSGASTRPTAGLAGRRIVTGLSRGRFISSYDELRYVIRKPEDRFARVLQE